MRSLTRFMMILSCLLSTSVSLAGEKLPQRFTLGQYVPENVWFYAHGVHNPERAWIEEQWGEVFEALKNSGIDRDLSSLFLSFLSDADRAEAEATLDKVTALFKSVQWCDLIGREVTLSERLSDPSPIPDYVLLTRGKVASAEANMSALVAILKELTGLSDKVDLVSSTMYGIEIWTVAPPEENRQKVPVRLYLFRKADIIGLAISSPGGIKDTLALLGGKSEKRPIVESPRFKEALGRIKTPEDSVMFFDIKALLRDLNGLMTFVAKEETSNGEVEPQEVTIVRKAFARFDVMDHIITTIETDGRRELTHNVAVLQPGKENSPLARVFLDRKPFDPFDQYIPVDATSFSVNGFIDVEQLYHVVLDFIEKEFPEGAEKIEKWNGWLAEVGFDPQRDLFSWWSGEIVSVTLPAAVITPMSSTESVLMIRVKDSESALQKVGAGIDWLTAKLQDHGQMLMIAPADVSAEGFREITHPMLAMFVRPVVGVKDGWLFLGTSAAAINKCLDVAAGKAPSIVQNKRFQEEGLPVKGPVLAVSFKDMTNLGQEMAGVVGIIGMMGGLMTAQIPDMPEDQPGAHEAKRVKRAIQKIMGIIMKLGPVLQKIDFFSSSASVCTVDGNIVRTECVTTYKPPPLKDEKTVTATVPAQ